MIGNFEKCLSYTLTEEGYHPNDSNNPFGYVNDPHDPGGITQLGVTKKAWEDYLGHPVTESDMRSLRPDTVSPFYKTNYWDTCSCEKLPEGVDLVVFDFAVNNGTGKAIRSLQDVIGVKSDGVLGPQTLEAINLTIPTTIITGVSDRRLAHLQSRPTFDRYGKGWSARVARVEDLAFKMVAR